MLCAKRYVFQMMGYLSIGFGCRECGWPRFTIIAPDAQVIYGLDLTLGQPVQLPIKIQLHTKAIQAQDFANQAKVKVEVSSFGSWLQHTQAVIQPQLLPISIPPIRPIGDIKDAKADKPYSQNELNMLVFYCPTQTRQLVNIEVSLKHHYFFYYKQRLSLRLCARPMKFYARAELDNTGNMSFCIGTIRHIDKLAFQNRSLIVQVLSSCTCKPWQPQVLCESCGRLLGINLYYNNQDMKYQTPPQCLVSMLNSGESKFSCQLSQDFKLSKNPCYVLQLLLTDALCPQINTIVSINLTPLFLKFVGIQDQAVLKAFARLLSLNKASMLLSTLARFHLFKDQDIDAYRTFIDQMYRHAIAYQQVYRQLEVGLSIDHIPQGIHNLADLILMDISGRLVPWINWSKHSGAFLEVLSYAPCFCKTPQNEHYDRAKDIYQRSILLWLLFRPCPSMPEYTIAQEYAIIQHWLSFKIDINLYYQGKTLLHWLLLAMLNQNQAWVMYEKEFQIFTLLLHHPCLDVNMQSQDNMQNTALHIVCQIKHPAVLNGLLTCPSLDLNIPNASGDMPLHILCAKLVQAPLLFTPHLDKLLAQGSALDINSLNGLGYTALDILCLPATQGLQLPLQPLKDKLISAGAICNIYPRAWLKYWLK